MDAVVLLAATGHLAQNYHLLLARFLRPTPDWLAKWAGPRRQHQFEFHSAWWPFPWPPVRRPFPFTTAVTFTVTLMTSHIREERDLKVRLSTPKNPIKNPFSWENANFDFPVFECSNARIQSQFRSTSWINCNLQCQPTFPIEPTTSRQNLYSPRSANVLECGLFWVAPDDGDADILSRARSKLWVHFYLCSALFPNLCPHLLFPRIIILIPILIQILILILIPIPILVLRITHSH